MGLQFEGAVDNISKPQLIFISDVLEKLEYKDTKVTIEAVGQAGDNYVANVIRVVVRKENGEFRMIAKIAPQQEIARMSTNTEKLFKNEHIMYTMVLPKFQQLEEQADLPKEDRLRFAECYGSFTEAPHEVILLEDLQVPGFVMMDRFKPLPDEYIRSVLKNFALLHSLSYALKHKEFGTYIEFTKGLFDMWGNMIGQSDEYFTALENTATMIVEGEHRKRHLEGCIMNALALSAKMDKKNKGSKYSIIQQGDTWTNNILFKIDDFPVQESVMIDYQLSNEGNPSHDLLYMIFNCTDHQSRLQHFNDWVDYYHSELNKALSNYGLKANYVYPRDQLDADMKRYGRIMLGLSIIVARVMLMKPGDALKMKEAMEKQDDGSETVEQVQIGNFGEEYILMFKKRLEELVDSYVKFGLL